MKNIAVFYGGQSVEHDVSVITGVMTVNSVNREKFNAIPIYVHNDGKFYTGELLRDLDNYKNLNFKKLTAVTLVCGENVLYAVKGKRIKPLYAISVAINCMHGERGEDGSLAGLLRMCAIPLASPQTLGSAVCMDKCFTKTVMRGLKIKTLPSVQIRSIADCERVKKKLKFPVIIKPACLGSSIGIRSAKNDEELNSAISYALRFGEKAIAEPMLNDFTEINCAAYRKINGEVKVSECERPVGREKFLSFGDKYQTGTRVFPADISKEASDKIKSVTERAYNELLLDGVVRIDYFLVGEDLYINEINTVPGSLAYYLFGQTLRDFTTMLDELITAAIKKGAFESTTQKTYKSGILNMSGGKSSKRL